MMIKVRVMDANTPGARLDKGLAGGAPGTPPTYVGMCHIFCGSVEAFQAGIPKYTDLSPVIQISEVVVERAGLVIAEGDLWLRERWPMRPASYGEGVAASAGTMVALEGR